MSFYIKNKKSNRDIPRGKTPDLKTEKTPELYTVGMLKLPDQEFFKTMNNMLRALWDKVHSIQNRWAM